MTTSSTLLVKLKGIIEDKIQDHRRDVDLYIKSELNALFWKGKISAYKDLLDVLEDEEKASKVLQEKEGFAHQLAADNHRTSYEAESHKETGRPIIGCKNCGKGYAKHIPKEYAIGSRFCPID